MEHVLTGGEILPTKNERRGFPYAFRLNLAAEGNSGHRKLVLAAESEDEYTSWTAALINAGLRNALTGAIEGTPRAGQPSGDGSPTPPTVAARRLTLRSSMGFGGSKQTQLRQGGAQTPLLPDGGRSDESLPDPPSGPTSPVVPRIAASNVPKQVSTSPGRLRALGEMRVRLKSVNPQDPSWLQSALKRQYASKKAKCAPETFRATRPRPTGTDLKQYPPRLADYGRIQFGSSSKVSLFLHLADTRDFTEANEPGTGNLRSSLRLGSGSSRGTGNGTNWTPRVSTSSSAAFAPLDRYVNKVLDFMEMHWSMSPASVVISITGGAQDFNLSPMLHSAFGQGLAKAAQATSAWLFTGGTDSGVMQLVGRALDEYDAQVHCIGIAVWGCIHGQQELSQVRDLDEKVRPGPRRAPHTAPTPHPTHTPRATTPTPHPRRDHITSLHPICGTTTSRPHATSLKLPALTPGDPAEARRELQRRRQPGEAPLALPAPRHRVKGVGGRDRLPRCPGEGVLPA